MRDIIIASVLVALIGYTGGYFFNSRTIVYETNYDINQDGKLDIEDWSAFGTRLQEQPDYVE